MKKEKEERKKDKCQEVGCVATTAPIRKINDKETENKNKKYSREYGPVVRILGRNDARMVKVIGSLGSLLVGVEEEHCVRDKKKKTEDLKTTARTAAIWFNDPND